MPKWTDEEVEWLRANFATAPWPEMEKHLRRERDAIISFARGVMGLKRPHRYPLWTDAEISALESARDFDLAVRKIPGRSPGAIKWKAATLGVRFNQPRAAPPRNPRHDDIVRANGTGSYAQIASRLNVSRGAVAGILHRHRNSP